MLVKGATASYKGLQQREQHRDINGLVQKDVTPVR